MRIRQLLASKSAEAIHSLYGKEFSPEKVQVQKTRPEFEGDLTIVVFPFLQTSKKSPEQTANDIGNWLKENVDEITSFNVIKGFLNLVINDTFWIEVLNSDLKPATSNQQPASVLLEYSSPNTNKPLHLGHIRNNLLGFSVSEILKEIGYKVTRTQIINDRGIHICKSMLAWRKLGSNETPESSGMKGDKLVGKYYVEFDKIYKYEIEESKRLSEDIISSLIINKSSPNFSDAHARDSIAAIFLYIRLHSWKRENQINIDIPISTDEFLDAYPNLLNELSNELQKFIHRYLTDLKNRIKNLSLKEIDATALKEEILIIANDFTPLVYDTHALLRIWEKQHKEGKGDVLSLWKKMNSWVYAGFDATYKALGVDFDKVYYESDTYQYGKYIVEEGLKKRIFYKKEDNSVWCDLKDYGMDEKLLLRSDGTSVYITQDIGTAIKRFEDYPQTSRLIYTVGNEQDYHFKVLFAILDKIFKNKVLSPNGGEETFFPSGGGINPPEGGITHTQVRGIAQSKLPPSGGGGASLYHLSYGMVDLPSGKMKSREGTVVDADDLISQMIETAKKTTEELGKAAEIPPEKREELYRIIGLGALKYFILKVDPKKQMLFNPQESIDFNGNTGPFIQYTYARIQSLLRKANLQSSIFNLPAGQAGLQSSIKIDRIEKSVIKLIYDFPDIVKESGDSYNPAVIANYIYELVKEYNHFYQSVPVLSESDKNLMNFRLALSQKTGEVIKLSMKMLGIEVPERM